MATCPTLRRRVAFWLICVESSCIPQDAEEPWIPSPAPLSFLFQRCNLAKATHSSPEELHPTYLESCILAQQQEQTSSAGRLCLCEHCPLHLGCPKADWLWRLDCGGQRLWTVPELQLCIHIGEELGCIPQPNLPGPFVIRESWRTTL